MMGVDPTPCRGTANPTLDTIGIFEDKPAIAQSDPPPALAGSGDTW